MNSATLLAVLTSGMVFLRFAAVADAQCSEPGRGVTWGPGIGPPPAACGGGGNAGGGNTGGGNTGNTNAGASSSGAASLLGDVGRTTVTGTDTRTGKSFPVGENIYGPFEAGFTSRQNDRLELLGCADGNDGHVAGGIDTHTAEQMVAAQCGITLPRIEGGEYVSLIDECGGHTNEYHFHERMSCLFKAEGAHSTKIGEAMDGQDLFGKWEDFTKQTLPELDACGGHYGATPDSNGKSVYHYHVQDAAPFTMGCFGPNTDGSLVTVAQCREFYDGCDGDLVDVTFPGGSKKYDLWCPCFDANGSNTGLNVAELAVFSSAASTTQAPTTATATAKPTTTTKSATAKPTTTAKAATTKAATTKPATTTKPTTAKPTTTTKPTTTKAATQAPATAEPTPATEAPMCCMAMTARCLACKQQVAVEDYCRSSPKTRGCPTAAGAIAAAKATAAPAAPTPLPTGAADTTAAAARPGAKGTDSRQHTGPTTMAVSTDTSTLSSSSTSTTTTTASTSTTAASSSSSSPSSTSSTSTAAPTTEGRAVNKGNINMVGASTARPAGADARFESSSCHRGNSASVHAAVSSLVLAALLGSF